MRTLVALLLLAAAAGAGLSPLPLLAIAFVGGVGLWRERSRGLASPDYGFAHEVQIATIYVRQGRLVLRRRKPSVKR